MKKFYVLLICILPLFGYGQRATVSTILNDPNVDVDDALALDFRGNLYGSNFAGNTVYKITPNGDVSPFVTGLANPNGLAFDLRGNLFVVEYSGGAIRKYDRSGNLLQTFNVGSNPSGLIRSRRGNSMIFTTANPSDVPNNGIFELRQDGTVNTIYQGAPLEAPVGLAYDRRGNLYVGDFNTRIIYRIPRRGTGIEYVATVPAPSNSVPFLAFIAYARGFLYGTIYGENKIYRINPRAVDDVEIYAGSVAGDMDGPLDEATFNFPSGIVANRSGSVLYVSEFSGLGNVRKITRRRGWGHRSGDEEEHQPNLLTTFNVFPNPTSDFINITLEASSEGDYSIEIYDLAAKKVYEKRSITDGALIQETISLAGWEAGIYELVVSNGAERHTKKIVVE